MSRIIGEIYSNKGFYIGDICYVLNDKLYHDFWGKEKGYKDGVYTAPGTGLMFAVAGTAYGDGCFVDEDGYDYGVDAGVIGLVPVELIDKEHDGDGRVVLCKGTARFDAEGGCFVIDLPNGKTIHIDTTYEYD